MTIRIPFALATALVASSCAPVQDQPQAPPAAHAAPAESGMAESGKDCFFLSEVSGFSSARRLGDARKDRILVHTGPRETYLFETFGSCPDLDFSETLAFDQHGPGQICRGMDVDLIVPGPIGPQRCAVGMIRKLTKQEAKAR